jgi:hypothetical protein
MLKNLLLLPLLAISFETSLFSMYQVPAGETSAYTMYWQYLDGRPHHLMLFPKAQGQSVELSPMGLAFTVAGVFALIALVAYLDNSTAKKSGYVNGRPAGFQTAPRYSIGF